MYIYYYINEVILCLVTLPTDKDIRADTFLSLFLLLVLLHLVHIGRVCRGDFSTFTAHVAWTWRRRCLGNDLYVAIDVGHIADVHVR